MRFLIILCGFLLLVGALSTSDANQQQDPTVDLYHLLNVTPSATTSEIKAAYRRQALLTHPDKQKQHGDQAVEEFRKVVQALEILTDDRARRRYDKQQKQQQQQQQRSRIRHDPPRHDPRHSCETPPSKPQTRTQRIHDAMSRVLSVTSMKQLRSIIHHQNNLLEQHLLVCFVTHGALDRLSQRMAYPYPFAGMSEDGGWESLLLTTKVRYTNENDVTRQFRIPKGSALVEPIFVLGRQGEHSLLGGAGDWPRLQTNDSRVFQEWVWHQLGRDGRGKWNNETSK